MPDKFKPVPVDFGHDVEEEIERYVWEQLEWLERSYKILHEQNAPKWRKLYLGTPAEAQKNFPWPNASNIMVQVVGEMVDTLAARVLGLLYATHPLWAFQLSMHADDPVEMEKARRTLEDFMDRVGYEPTELDLYRIEGDWFIDAAKLGTSWVKVNYEQLVEAVAVGYTEQKRLEADETPIYEGPRVTKARFEDVMADPTCTTLEDAPFVVHKRVLKRRALEERKFMGLYDEKAVNSIIDHPDRYTPKLPERDEQQNAGFVNSPAGSDDTTAEWDISECYFWWWAGSPRRKFRLIYTYHKRTKTVLRKVFNFLPRNALPIIMSRVGHRGDGLLGHGFGEMLELYQEGLTAVLNQRIDNATVANVRALRVSPRMRTLDSAFELMPAGLIWGDKDDVEALQIGDVYPSSFENEQSLLRHVSARSGVEPAISGMGTGGVTKRPAVYSSLGTLAVMQENNSRVNLKTSDFRHAHVKLGSLLVRVFGKFGTAGRERMFGQDARYLMQALDAFTRNQLAIPIRASVASLNREVEKQNDMILVNLLQRYNTAVAQLIQAAANPMTPPPMQEYLKNTVRTQHAFMRRVLKDFGYDEPDAYLPVPQLDTPGAAGAPPGGGPMAPGSPPVAGAAGAAAGGSAGMAGGQGWPGLPGVPAPTPRA